MNKKHDRRCEVSKSQKYRCKCSCTGEQHGVIRSLKRYEDQPITKHMGGEIEQELNKLQGKMFTCSCGKGQILDDFYGYASESGLKDKDGRTWWVYYTCNNKNRCNYDWAWHKIEYRIEKEIKEKGKIDRVLPI